MTTAEIITQLQQAIADLLWVSESDYPFEIVTWDKGTEIVSPVLFKDLAAPDAPIETILLADFFAPVLIIEDWYETEELATVDRYTNLLYTIESNLDPVQVFRVGEVEVSIYIIGKTPDGDLLGLKTTVVET